MPVVSSAADIFEEMLGGVRIPPSERVKKSFPYFDVRVGCVKRRPPRHDYFEFIRDMGLSNIAPVMSHQPFPCSGELCFVFPERWMGVAEQQAFIDRLHKHPQAVEGKIKRVDIITSSPLIISSFFREQILILTFSDDSNYSPGETSEPDILGYRGGQSATKGRAAGSSG